MRLVVLAIAGIFILAQFALFLQPTKAATASVSSEAELVAALADSNNDTINLSSSFSTTAEVVVDRTVVINGNGHTLTPTFSFVSNAGSNSVIEIIGADSVTINNLSIDGSGGIDIHGVNIYEATNVDLNHLSSLNNDKSGIVVNSSTVTVDDVATGSNTWHGINVDVKTALPSVLTINGVSIHTDAVHIYSDHYLSGDVTVNDTENQYTIFDNPPDSNNYDDDRLYQLDPERFTYSPGNSKNLKIDICHAPGADSNPYVVNPINLNGLNGHEGHDDDIIPPNPDMLEGQNWTRENIDIWKNDCNVPDDGQVGGDIDECEASPAWAGFVESFDQGLTKGGGTVADNRSNPDDALGEPDAVDGVVENFYALGFGGELVVGFSGHVLNVDGDDLSFHEMTFGNRDDYGEETAKVEVSQTGADGTWLEIGTASGQDNDGGDGVTLLDFDGTGLDWIRYVRLTDTSDINDPGFPNEADGYDIDAIDATEMVCQPPEPDVLADIRLCKIDDGQNPLAGWQLSLLGDEVDEVVVDSKTNSSSNSVNSASLPEGNYVAKASGTFEYRGSTGLLADARFSERLPSDATYGGPYSPWSTGNIGWLHMDGNNTVWGNVFSPSHTYYAPLALSDSSASFYIGDDNHGDNDGEVTVKIYEGYTGLTGGDGCVTFEDVPHGDYEIKELLQPGWENVSGLGGVVVEGDRTFNVVNQEIAEVNVLAHKIVCDVEASLPNWATGQNGAPSVIGEDTASDWLAQNQEGCELMEDWDFQWKSGHITNPEQNPTTNPLYGEVDDWNTFGPTDESGVASTTINLNELDDARLSLREVLTEDYIPFTFGSQHKTNEDNVSAEFYCGNNVLNYDNVEWISNLEDGDTLYCIAWNVHIDAGEIQGRKYHDVNANGDFDQEEKQADGNPNRLNGWTINLYDTEWNLLDSMVTGDDGTAAGNVGQGQYRFVGLGVGDYFVCEVNQTGWTQAEPASGPQLEVGSPFCHEVSINHPEHKVDTIQFGNYENVGQIQGLVYNDENNNGNQDEGEDPLDDWKVVLLTRNSPHEVVGVYNTGPDGTFIFQNLAYNDQYYVCQNIQDGWLQTQIDAEGSGLDALALAVGDIIPGGDELDDLVTQFCYNVALSPGDPTDADSIFGNFLAADDGFSLGDSDSRDQQVLGETDGAVLAATGQGGWFLTTLGTVIMGLALATRMVRVKEEEA